MLDLVLLSILAIVRFIAGMISIVLLGMMAMMFIRTQKNMIKQALQPKMIAMAFMVYAVIVLVIGLAPSNY